MVGPDDLPTLPAVTDPVGLPDATVGIQPEPVVVVQPEPATSPMDEPEQAAISFVERSREEARGAVGTLNAEAEALRARLQKVEAGLARWQAVLDALEAQVGAAPGVVDGDAPPLELEPIGRSGQPPIVAEPLPLG